MSKLNVYDQNGNLLKVRQLDRERIKIGRRADSDIQLDHLSVSGEHALVTNIRNDSFLQDLGSTNGVRVNGRLVKNHHLQEGDEITIAIFNLKFQFEPWVMPESSWATTIGKTPHHTAIQTSTRSEDTLFEIGHDDGLGLTRELLSHRMAPDTLAGESDATVIDLGSGVLRLMGGHGAGKQLELDKPVLTLGKPGIQTAVIGKKSVGYFLTYVEGVSYPLVNGVEIGATPYHLQDHDIIEVAGTRLEFFYK
ncbi:MAG: FHA domain-containing protein [Burkholderiales bacterium]|nr:FHA domain-containing protein [Burkholderiales bacterium]